MFENKFLTSILVIFGVGVLVVESEDFNGVEPEGFPLVRPVADAGTDPNDFTPFVFLVDKLAT